MSELEIFRCGECEEHVFPERLRCPRCGSWSFERVPAGPGQVEQRTRLRDGPRLGSVRLEKGPVIIARLEADGPNVRLEHHPDGAITAQRGG